MRIRLNYEDCVNEWELYIEVDDYSDVDNSVKEFNAEYLSTRPDVTFRWNTVVEQVGGVNPGERIDRKPLPARLGELVADMNAFVFDAIDGEPEFNGAEAGKVAIAAERAATEAIKTILYA